jgi:hypothetical protein
MIYTSQRWLEGIREAKMRPQPADPKNQVLIFGILIATALWATLGSQQKQTQLAGLASFPSEEYSAWLNVQMNPSIINADKVSCTINTFFDLKYKGWLKLELPDFGFLFDLSDDKAAEDYAYERGLFHLLLTGWRSSNNSLESYQYQPKYYQLSVDDDIATVRVNPDALITHNDPKGVVTSSPWTEHVFTLVLKDNLWIIKSVVCSDPTHNLHPHGSDFNKLARDLRENIQKEQIKEEAEIAILMRDPRIQERFFHELKGVTTLGSLNYSRSAVRSYARTYSSNDPGTSSYNPLFISFESDCANFVSQCVWRGFGGWNDADHIENHDLPMIDDDVAGKTWWADSEGAGVWVTGGGGYRYCWTNVDDFIYMIVNNYSTKGKGVWGRMGLMPWTWPGDIVKQKTASHGMIISEIHDYDGDWYTYWNEIYICAHTNNRRDKLLKDLYPSYTLHSARK